VTLQIVLSASCRCQVRLYSVTRLVVTDLLISFNIPLSSLACNRLILSLRGVYFQGGGTSGDSEIPTISYHSAINRPPLSTRTEGGNPHLHTARSPNLRNEIKLCVLRSPGRWADQKVGSMDSDWDQETEETSVEVQSISPTSAIRHSRARSFADVPPAPGDLSPTLSPTSSVPLFGQVTVTRTRRVVTDEGVEYDLPVEEEEGTSWTKQSRGRTVDWWDSRETVHGAGTNGHSPRPGVYESRVGYRHDQIPEESEEQFVSHGSPRSM
jgi:hypothetical protein